MCSIHVYILFFPFLVPGLVVVVDSLSPQDDALNLNFDLADFLLLLSFDVVVRSDTGSLHDSTDVVLILSGFGFRSRQQELIKDSINSNVVEYPSMLSNSPFLR